MALFRGFKAVAHKTAHIFFFLYEKLCKKVSVFKAKRRRKKKEPNLSGQSIFFFFFIFSKPPFPSTHTQQHLFFCFLLSFFMPPLLLLLPSHLSSLTPHPSSHICCLGKHPCSGEGFKSSLDCPYLISPPV